MTDSAGLQFQKPVDAQAMSGCEADAPEKVFPLFSESLSYDQLAEELSSFFGKPVSKNTLKNNWFSAGGRIDRIYQGLELPSPLKTDSGRITPFGIAAVFEFAALVHFGSKHYDDYVLNIRNRYAAGEGNELDRIDEIASSGSDAPTSDAIVPFVEVEVGNHQTIVPSPRLPQTYQTLQEALGVLQALGKPPAVSDSASAG